MFWDSSSLQVIEEIEQVLSHCPLAHTSKALLISPSNHCSVTHLDNWSCSFESEQIIESAETEDQNNHNIMNDNNMILLEEKEYDNHFIVCVKVGKESKL